MVHFNCPTCNTQVDLISIRDLRHHLNQHKLLGKLNFPIRCLQSENCKSTLSSINSFMKHFETYHYDGVVDLVEDTFPPQPVPIVIDPLPPAAIEIIDEGERNEMFMEVEGNNEGHNIQGRFSFSEKITLIKEKMKTEALNMIVELRAKGNIPSTVSVDILRYLKNFVDLIVDETAEAVVEVETFKESIVATKEGLMTLKSVIPGLATEYRIRQLYDQHPNFVSPEPVVLGYRDETILTKVGGESAIRIVNRPNTAQYCSIAKTLKNYLSDPVYFRTIFPLNPINYFDQDEITCFLNSTRGKEMLSALPANKQKTLFLQIFFDGLGLTSYNRSSTSVHNSGMFYFTILNLPPRFNASLSNIHMLAMCNTLDLKNEGGLDILLSKIVDEITYLETHGITVETQDGPVQVYAKLAQFTGDNLGMNQMFGFIESFASDFCCLLCYATREEMQTYERESDFSLRTKETYANDLTMLNSLPAGKNHYRGVKRQCALNALPSYHIIDNWTNDSMHTSLEGFMPYVTGAVLFHINRLCPEITLSFVNQQILQVTSGFISGERHNKPGPLSSFLEPGKDMTPKQSSIQMGTLFRILPLIIGGKLYGEEALRYWELFMTLQEIVDLIMAPTLTESLLNHMSQIIETFLDQFKILFPTLSIRPKIHFLLHYPPIIRKNGPTRSYWCMNFERMNGAVKLPAHIIQNFRDPQQTLAYRRQCSALNNFLEGKHNRNFVYVKKLSEISIDSLASADNFDEFRHLFEYDSVSVASKITVNAVEYRDNTFVILGPGDFGYSFGKIKFSICEDLNSVVLFVSVYRTKKFDVRRYSYVIEKESLRATRLVRVSDLLDSLPLDLIKMKEGNFIRLKYYVLPKRTTEAATD